MLSPFRLLQPTSLAEACAELAHHGDRARVYSGGVHLILLMRFNGLAPDYLVDVKGIDRLRELSLGPDGVWVGAAVSHRRLETDPLAREHLPLLAEAETLLGNVRVRLQGSLGGNLCFADSHADPGPVVLLHDARLVVAGPSGERELGLDAFLLAEHRVDLGPGELLAGLRLTPLPDGWSHSYQRLARFYRPMANAAVAARLAGGRLAGVRLAAGCIGPKPARLTELETKLVGCTPEEAARLIDEAGPYLAERLRPTDDLEGGADYKTHLAGVLLRRGLETAIGRARLGATGRGRGTGYDA